LIDVNGINNKLGNGRGNVNTNVRLDVGELVKIEE
jgi:hypothetical protein